MMFNRIEKINSKTYLSLQWVCVCVCMCVIDLLSIEQSYYRSQQCAYDRSLVETLDSTLCPLTQHPQHLHHQTAGRQDIWTNKQQIITSSQLNSKEFNVVPALYLTILKPLNLTAQWPACSSVSTLSKHLAEVSVNFYNFNLYKHNWMCLWSMNTTAGMIHDTDLYRCENPKKWFQLGLQLHK